METSTPDNSDANPMDKVNEILNNVEATDDGKLNFEGMEISDDLQVAVIAEKRRRDTQSAYTKNQQTLKMKDAEIDALRTLVPTAISQLPQEEQDDLEVLKFSDPEAWRKKMDVIEAEATTKAREVIDTTVAEATSTASVEFQKEERASKLEAFNQANPETPLTDEQLAYDVPPRLLKQLEDGTVTFEEVLVKAHAFINGTKAIKNPQTNNQPSMSDAPSGQGTKTAEALAESYKKQII